MSRKYEKVNKYIYLRTKDHNFKLKLDMITLSIIPIREDKGIILLWERTMIELNYRILRTIMEIKKEGII
jgi:hypothetical protein